MCRSLFLVSWVSRQTTDGFDASTHSLSCTHIWTLSDRQTHTELVSRHVVLSISLLVTFTLINSLSRDQLKLKLRAVLDGFKHNWAQSPRSNLTVQQRAKCLILCQRGIIKRALWRNGATPPLLIPAEYKMFQSWVFTHGFKNARME